MARGNQKKQVENYLKSLGHSPNYIRHILCPKTTKRKEYTKEDVTNALLLRSMSNQTYEYLRKNNILSLPGEKVLEKWVQSFNCKPGLDSNFLLILKKKLEDATFQEKQAVVLFDEVNLRKVYQYDTRNKQVYQNHSKMQVVMVRSLFSNWKQVIFFDFDCNMTKDLLSHIIVKCENFGINIRGIVFDMGNHTFIKELKVRSELNHVMVNPADSSRHIFLFPDCPHGIKN